MHTYKRKGTKGKAGTSKGTSFSVFVSGKGMVRSCRLRYKALMFRVVFGGRLLSKERFPAHSKVLVGLCSFLLSFLCFAVCSIILEVTFNLKCVR